MQRRKIFIAPIVLAVLFAGSLTTRSSLAAAAADECLSKPGASAPAGSHWYYRVNRADRRHCWYLGPAGAKVHSEARETTSSSPRQTLQRAAETPRTALAEAAPVPAAPEPAVAAEAAAPTELPEPEDAVPQFAARWPDLAGSVALGAREPAAASSAYAEEHAAEDEMPLVWPVLTETERAGAPRSASASGGRPTFIVGVLALLLAGAVFRLTVLSLPGRWRRRDQRAAAPAQPRRPARAEFGDTTGNPARAVRRPAPPARDDIEATLQRLHDRQRAA